MDDRLSIGICRPPESFRPRECAARHSRPEKHFGLDKVAFTLFIERLSFDLSGAAIPYRCPAGWSRRARDGPDRRDPLERAADSDNVYVVADCFLVAQKVQTSGLNPLDQMVGRARRLALKLQF